MSLTSLLLPTTSNFWLPVAANKAIVDSCDSRTLCPEARDHRAAARKLLPDAETDSTTSPQSLQHAHASLSVVPTSSGFRIDAVHLQTQTSAFSERVARRRRGRRGLGAPPAACDLCASSQKCAAPIITFVISPFTVGAFCTDAPPPSVLHAFSIASLWKTFKTQCLQSHTCNPIKLWSQAFLRLWGLSPALAGNIVKGMRIMSFAAMSIVLVPPPCMT